MASGKRLPVGKASAGAAPTGANPRQSLGRRGEGLAADYLEGQGYRIIARNFRSAYGEIDLIARPAGEDSGEVLVFIEVKTRSTGAYGNPEQAVTPAKQRHLIEAAQAYLQEHPEWTGDWRIDVIAVRAGRAGRAAEIRHFEDAVH